MKILNGMKTLNKNPICSLVTALKMIIQFFIIIIFENKIYIKYLMFTFAVIYCETHKNLRKVVR